MNNINSESFTMNEKTIVYIILLGLLLFLYYKKRDVMIIFAFIVLLGSTFIFGGGIREGAKSGKGKGGGGGGCSKIGFTAPKIDKKDVKGTLEKALKNIEKVANKHWPFDDVAGNKPKNDKSKETFDGVVQSEYFQGESKKIENDKAKQENSFMFVLGCAGIYMAFIGEKASEEEQQKIMKDLTPKKISNAIKGGEIYLDILNKNHKTLEGSDVKKLSSYLTCLCKQWIQILKQYKKAKGSGGDE